jgi:hypothetical protein
VPKPVSKRQARFFGAVAGGKARGSGMTRKEARDRLRGIKLKNLPEKRRKRRK